MTANRAFGIAADMLLGLMQQVPNQQPTANDLAKLLEELKRLAHLKPNEGSEVMRGWR